MNCTKCGATLESDAVFCPECGTPVEKQEQPQQAATIFCPMCGAALEEGSEWCTSCGVALAAAQKHEARSFSIEPFKKYLIPAAAVVGGLIVLVVLISLFAGKSEPVLYIKDDSLYASKWKEDTEVRVEKNMDNGENYTTPRISENGKYLYYGTGNDYGYNLYRKKMRDLEGDDERIAKDVKSHILLDNNKVVYLDTDNELNVADGEESERVAKDVEEYKVNEKQTEIIWIDEDGDLCKRDIKLKKDDERLAKEVDYFVAATDNFEEIAYVAEGAVYVLSDYKDEQKVFEMDEVYSDYYVLEGDSNQLVFYFAEEADTEKSVAYDFIQDDLLASDEAITEPKRSDYEHTEIKKDYWGDPYEETILSDEYYTAMDEYEEKLWRDRDRENLKEYEVSHRKYDLYYYTVKDGSEKLSSAYSFSMNIASYDKALLFVRQVTEMESVSAKMSDFYDGDKSFYDFYDELENAANGEATVTLYEGKKGAQLDVADDEYTYPVGVNEKKKLIYTRLESGGSNYDLVSIKYGSKLGDMETIEQDVEDAICRNDQIFYISDDDLYCEGERIDKDVERISGSAIDDGKWVALLEREDGDGEGDLKLWNGRKLIDVERDVVSYVALEKNKIAILHDYSNSSGTLSYYNGRKVERIDRDVEQLINCY